MSDERTELQKMADFVESVDPMSGPNIQRYIKAHLRDNGDGTMTWLRYCPFQNEQLQDSAKR